MMVYAYDQQAGPLAGFVASDIASLTESAFEARELVVNLTLLLILLHIGGVVLASFVHKENLVGAMLTGKKRPPED
jgi:cytochrome b